MKEICIAFNWVIEKELLFYWGTSYWTSQQVMDAIKCCKKIYLIKPIVEQPKYNLLQEKMLK